MNSVHHSRRTVSEVAALLGGTVEGNGDAQVTGLNRVELARDGELTFVVNASYAKFLSMTAASCILVTKGVIDRAPPTKTVIWVEDAYRSFVKLMQLFYPAVALEAGLRHQSAVIHQSAQVDPTAAISAGCVVGELCVVGKNAQLFPNVVLYPGCSVGADSVIHANVSCLPGTVVGERCLIHAGAVLGSDGFGFLENSDGSFDKVPQVGTVYIGNDVEIGANTTVDRAAVGYTRIGDGVKIDNLVHIAHNVVVGDHTAIAAQAGISGSTRLGERNRIAGQVGVVGHISTADDVIVEAQSGVSKAITAKGAYFGSPAKEHRTALRMEAALRQLPQLLNEFRDMQRRLETLLSDEHDGRSSI